MVRSRTESSEYFEKTKWRSRFVNGLMILFLLAIVVKLGYVQVVQADWLMNKAIKVWEKGDFMQPERGMIVDRNGKPLAYNAKAYTIVAFPKQVEDPLNSARMLSPLINMSEERIFDLLTRNNSYQVELGPGGRKISEEILEQVLDLELVGLSYIEESIRYYPNNELAANVIGFIDAKGEGVNGIEFFYNDQLSGEKGSISYISDGKRREVPSGVSELVPAKNGKDITLTIDANIQMYVERALDRAEEVYQAQRMTAIVADPVTGEILAMANRPSFDLNNVRSQDAQLIYDNFALQSFEPGSTFKLVTLAAALDNKVLKLNDEIYDPGYINVTGGRISNWNKSGDGYITVQRALEVSSNVGFVKIGLEKLGWEKLSIAMQNYGFGEATNITLPGEAKGNIFQNRTVYPIEVATTSFGQGITTTPVQLLRFTSAIANGGYLVNQHIVKSEELELPEKIMSEETAALMREAMQNVVTNGSATRAQIAGYTVAGKTGTAQKVSASGGYAENKNIVSFIGFAPADNPRLVIYVAIDEPVSYASFGSTVAAPVFREIMQDSLLYLGIAPDEQKESNGLLNFVEMPNFIGRYISESVRQANNLNINTEVIGNGNIVVKQSVQTSDYITDDVRLWLITGNESGEITPAQYVMPNLAGMSKREVLSLLDIIGIKYELYGSGYAIEQSIPSGEMWSHTDRLTVVFKANSSAKQDVLDETKDIEDVEEKEELD